MASIEVINRGTEASKGGGLPFVEKKEYLLTNTHDAKEVLRGWPNPRSILPSFQLWIAGNNVDLVAIEYQKASTSSSVSYPVNIPAPFLPEQVFVSGVRTYVFSSNKVPVIAPLPPCGMFTLVLTFTLDGQEKKYYSHEVTLF